jgi:hypothetical protein
MIWTRLAEKRRIPAAEKSGGDFLNSGNWAGRRRLIAAAGEKRPKDRPQRDDARNSQNQEL